MQGRIWFPGNPWPDGHRITDFAWTGRLDDDGLLWFDLSLTTADYDDDPPQLAGRDDAWGSPIAWRNYHSCSLSSTKWDDATGLLAATPHSPFRFRDLRPQRRSADPLPIGDLDDSPAFHIYLLGHDSVAAHEIEFTRQETGGYRIGWTGRIALTYAGDEEFRYEFRAEVRDVTLDKVGLPQALALDEARRHLAGLVDVAFNASEVDGERVLIPAGPDAAS